MFHILGFLFIIIIAILLIGLSIIGTVIRNIFGLGGRRTSSNSGPYQKGNGNYQPGGYSYNDNRQSSEEAQRNCSPKTRESMWILKKSRSRD